MIASLGVPAKNTAILQIQKNGVLFDKTFFQNLPDNLFARHRLTRVFQNTLHHIRHSPWRITPFAQSIKPAANQNKALEALINSLCTVW